jgi:hypothetical protein
VSDKQPLADFVLFIYFSCLVVLRFQIKMIKFSPCGLLEWCCRSLLADLEGFGRCNHQKNELSLIRLRGLMPVVFGELVTVELV